MINKLLGFYELQKTGLPVIKFKEIKTINDINTIQSSIPRAKLWTLRTAVYCGDDMWLPKAVGVTIEDAILFAKPLLEDENISIVMYPYFWALSSGNLVITHDSILVEAISGDLWKMNSQNIDYTFQYQISTETLTSGGLKEFLTKQQNRELLQFGKIIFSKYKNDILSSSGMQFEWSYASYVEPEMTQEWNLIFYEMRTL